jgi:hypothetical protein
MMTEQFCLKRNRKPPLDKEDEDLICKLHKDKINKAIAHISKIHAEIAKYLKSMHYVVIPSPIRFGLKDHMIVSVGSESISGAEMVSLGVIKVVNVKWAEINGFILPTWDARVKNLETHLLAVRAVVIANEYIDRVDPPELATVLLYVASYEFIDHRYKEIRRKILLKEAITNDMERQLITEQEENVKRIIKTVRVRFRWFNNAYERSEAIEHDVLEKSTSFIYAIDLSNIAGTWLIQRLSDKHTYHTKGLERRVFLLQCQKRRETFIIQYPTFEQQFAKTKAFYETLERGLKSIELNLVRLGTRAQYPVPIIKLIDKKTLRKWRKQKR